MRKISLIFLFSLTVFSLTGCAALCDRRKFASDAANAAEPILKGYRGYVSQDNSLNDNEKKMRNNLADELDNLLKEGAQ